MGLVALAAIVESSAESLRSLSLHHWDDSQSGRITSLLPLLAANLRHLTLELNPFPTALLPSLSLLTSLQRLSLSFNPYPPDTQVAPHLLTQLGNSLPVTPTLTVMEVLTTPRKTIHFPSYTFLIRLPSLATLERVYFPQRREPQIVGFAGGSGVLAGVRDTGDHGVRTRRRRGQEERGVVYLLCRYFAEIKEVFRAATPSNTTHVSDLTSASFDQLSAKQLLARRRNSRNSPPQTGPTHALHFTEPSWNRVLVRPPLLLFHLPPPASPRFRRLAMPLPPLLTLTLAALLTPAVSQNYSHPLTPNGIKAGVSSSAALALMSSHLGWWYDWYVPRSSPTPHYLNIVFFP